uniref:NBS-LRR type disease resistance protein n=1 Tax=Poncirus trifoliata TaxID=37690 RepID=Q8H6R9_PONTR|nr:NBS-LRR type disease resistance protein [Citrus trifoliata]
MGNILQISISCDGTCFNRCLDCFLGKAAYVRNLQKNVEALKNELPKLIAKKDDVMARVVNAERQQMMTRLNEVQLWLSRVDAVTAGADELIRIGSQEIEKLCLGGYCSKNCKSSKKFGKQVDKKLSDVKILLAEGSFAVVAQRAPESVADERPIEPAVGIQSQLEQVWRCLVEEPVGIVGLYGMGGVGKTTLLTHLNNKFLGQRDFHFDFLIWVVVSKDLQIEKIQEIIGKKVGLFNDSWMKKNLAERAVDIYNVLKEKKFVLLLDDVWQRVDFATVGVPIPPRDKSASKVVFTTRSTEVCGRMGAHKKIEVECLSANDAWELFRQNVGEETLNGQPKILELAERVAKECGCLPLALIVTGRAMACKKTPAEWRDAIKVLQTSASEFPGLENNVLRVLKFSYDSLPDDTTRSCLLYCCLFPEDYRIYKENLIDCWIGEGFLKVTGKYELQDRGHTILGNIVHACLLEEEGDDVVKMHDVIRDMTLWIACDTEKTEDTEKKKENYLVYEGAGLTEAPNVREWENAKRLSLMETQIRNLSEVPTCLHLLTLFLVFNEELEMITGDFFKSMPCLKVLNLSGARRMSSFPLGVSVLVSLQHLDLSGTAIQELPKELNALENLKSLNLDQTHYLITIPRQLISRFSCLVVLRMFGVGDWSPNGKRNDSDLFSGGDLLVEALRGLKHLEVLSLTLNNSQDLQCVLNSEKLRSCTQALYLHSFKRSEPLDVSALAGLEHLNRLWIHECEELEELKMARQPFVFQSLEKIQIYGCHRLKNLTFLLFAPNLKSIEVSSCFAMEEIISEVKFADFPEVMPIIKPFAQLYSLRLGGLTVLKSIYKRPLPFPCLRDLTVNSCDELRKLPLDSNSAKERKIVIRGYTKWWEQLQWEDQDTQNAFRPCFRSIN